MKNREPHKFTALLLSALLLLTALSGCGGTTADTAADTAEETASGEAAAVTEEIHTEKYAHVSANGIETNDSGYMRPGLTALELTKMMGNGINLGNTMEACDSEKGSFSADPSDYETYWGQPVTTQEMLTGMKACGFDTVRIPVAWITNATTLGKDGDCTIDEAYLDRVEEIINYALNADMYVIINDHWDGGWWGMFGSESAETRQKAMEVYVSMWTQIAGRYKEYSDYLIFESANEELGARFDENSSLYCSDSIDSYMDTDARYALTNEVNQAFVDAVRATGGNNADRFLLIAGYGTNIDSTCDGRFIMPSDTAESKLLVSVHFYDPWAYCGDGQSTVKWGTVNDYETMCASLEKMTQFTEQGYGVVIGEYGVLHDKKLQENTVEYHTCFLSLCDLYNYTSCLWDCSGFFVRSELKMIDSDFAKLYASNNYAMFEGMSDSEISQVANRRIKKLIDAAPETFRTDSLSVDDATAVAWIMWDSADWSLVYSVGDTYNPDNISEGVKPTEVIIDGEGTYTVGLDFTGTAAGYSDGTAFSALAIGNGELLYPGYIIEIEEVLINGEPYELIARPYTTSDDGSCTRVNLFNEWVTQVPAEARTADGSLDGCSASIIDRALDIETITITFRYGPAA